MAATLEARAVITAVDETGKAFNSVKERIAAIEKVASVMNRTLGSVSPIAKQVGAVSEQIDRTSSAMARMGEAGRAVGSVASAIATVERASAGMAGSIGRTSAAVEKLSGDLSGAKAKLAAISDFKLSARGVTETALALRKAEQDVRALAAKIDGVPSPARSMVAAHAGALAEVRNAERAFERQTASASAARTALAEMGVPLNRLRAEEEQLAAAAEKAAAALQRQASVEREAASAAERTAVAERRAGEASQRGAALAARAHAREAAEREAEIRHHGAMNFLTMGAAGVVSAHSVFEGISETAHAGAEYNHEIVGLQNAGRSPEEIAAIEKRSSEVVGKLPTASYLENMKVIAETTGAFGSVEHAMDHLEFMQKTMSILKASGGEHIKGGVGEVGRALAKTFEERMTKPEEFEKEASAMIPAMVMSGGVFNPEQLYAFAQQAKSALPNYSMRFLSGIAPSIITAMGGDRAGTAANAFNSIIMGKANDKKQAEAWEKFGLLDESMVIKKAGHTTSWTAGAVKDTNLALQDPLEWAEKVALPAMQAKGVNIEDRLELAKVLGTMFRNQNSNMFANEMMQAASRLRLHKDEYLKNEVGTPDEIYKRNQRDPTVQATALKAALENLMVTLSNPLMGRAGLTMNAVASGMNTLANVMKEHPGLAASSGVVAAASGLAGAGYLSYQFMNGFGLGASATALEVAAGEQTGAAGAVSAAAARLGAAGLEHGFENVIPGARGQAVRTVERVVVREGEHLAEGAAEAAIGGKIVSAIEGGLKGGLAVGALEVAATAGITLTAGSVAFLGITAAAIIAGLAASTPPKHHASDDPNFGKVLPPSSLDLNDPKLQEKSEEAKKPWFNRNGGAHPRGSLPAYRDTDHRGHWVMGPHGTRHWALEQEPDLKNPPFYATTVGPDGRLTTMPRLGLGPDPSDPRTWAHIGPNAPAPHPELYAPADVPMPPVRPGSNIERRTFGAYLDFARTQAEAGTMPMPTRVGGGVVPVSIVNMPPAARDGWLDGERPAIEERSRRGAAMFRADHEGTVGRHMMEHEDASPHVDTSGIEAGKTAGSEFQQILAAIGAMTVAPSVNNAAMEAALATARQLKAELQSLGTAGRAAGGTSGSLGPSYAATAPTGRMGGPR